MRTLLQFAALAVVLVTPSAPGPGDASTRMTATFDAGGRLVTLADADRPVLRYVARRQAPTEAYLEQVAEANRVYARPRSGYVHPLFGLDDEELTLDWSLDHPHHRGIYWAWPEVRWGAAVADLHALQGVESVPVGEPVLSGADAFSRVAAQNLWLWRDGTPLVFERVVITAFALDDGGSRAIDIDLRFDALVEGVSLARRGTDLYGGLNVRLAPVSGLSLAHHSQAQKDGPRFAWSAATGTWRAGGRSTTLAILEHPSNPEFPGDWVTYEELPWFQPAFPRAGTRRPLVPDAPLTLRYRLVIKPGGAQADGLAAAADRYAATTPPPLDPQPREQVR